MGILSLALHLSLFHCSLGWYIRDISLTQKEKQYISTPILLQQPTSRLADTSSFHVCLSKGLWVPLVVTVVDFLVACMKFLGGLNVAFSAKVFLLLLWWPLLMLSRQDCKWPPGLARPHTAGSSTVSERFSGKKGHRHFGKGLQVDAGGSPEWLSGFHVLPLTLYGHLVTAIRMLSVSCPVCLFQLVCFGPRLSLVSLWLPTSFCSGGFT